MATPTRAELEAELESLKTELDDARVPDGRTGLTTLSLSDYRAEIRRRMSEIRASLRALDARAGLTCNDGLREF